ncbi:MAG: hypothetical protein RIA64_07515 [Rhodospirillales bacterium]
MTIKINDREAREIAGDINIVQELLTYELRKGHPGQREYEAFLDANLRLNRVKDALALS